eukprot:1158329-Pelagomonas_calceolata.AAC.9
MPHSVGVVSAVLTTSCLAMWVVEYGDGTCGSVDTATHCGRGERGSDGTAVQRESGKFCWTSSSAQNSLEASTPRHLNPEKCSCSASCKRGMLGQICFVLFHAGRTCEHTHVYVCVCEREREFYAARRHLSCRASQMWALAILAPRALTFPPKYFFDGER